MDLDDDGNGLPFHARDPINQLAETLFAKRLGNGICSLHAYLRSVMIEQCKGQLFTLAQELFSANEGQIINFIICSLSNNLLNAGELQSMVRWVGSTTNYEFLTSILSTGGHTVKAIAGKLFQGAIDSGDEKLVVITLDAGVDPDMALGYSKRNALQVAATRGFVNIARVLLEHGASPNVQPQVGYGGTALQESAKRENAELVDLLLDYGAIADGTSFDQPETALYISVCQRNLQTTQMLLDHDADVNYCNDQRQRGRAPAPYALSVAIADGNTKLTTILLIAGANAETRAGWGPYRDRTSLQQACAGGTRMRELVSLLLEHGAGVNAPALGERGRTALQEAVFSQDMEIVQTLLNWGADINSDPSPDDGRTAIQLAAQRGDIDLVNLLLAHGANLNAPAAPRGGFTALQAAAKSASPDIVQLLLRKGAQVNRRPSQWEGQTALQAATSFGAGFGSLPPASVHRILRGAEDVGYLSLPQLQIVRMLLDAGANWDYYYSTSRPHSAEPILHQAVKSAVLSISHVDEALEFVKILLDSGLDVNAIHEERTALQTLIFTSPKSPQVPDLVRRLIAAGADVNARPAKTYYGEFDIEASLTALQAAAAEGDIDLVRILVEAGADVNARAVRPNGISAINAAAKYGNEELVQLLLGSGAAINAPAGTDDDTPALLSAISRGKLGMAEILLAAGANINTPGPILYIENDYVLNQTPLQVACWTKRLNIVELLLEREPDVDRCGDDGYSGSPLALALQNGSKPLVKALLAAGADIDYVAYDKYSMTPIQMAVKNKGLTLVRLLLDAGADVNIRSANQRTTMHLAIFRGNPTIIYHILEAGADIHAEALGDEGRTALQAAVERNNVTMLQLLLDRGADINAKPAVMRGRTALQIAAEEGNIALVELLLGRGADVNAEPAYSYGVTALQAAAIGGFLGIAQKLLEAGAEVDAAAPREGRTALQGAAEHGRLDMCQLLLNNMAGEDRDFDRLDYAMKLASGHGHLAIVSLIEDHYNLV